MHFLLKVIEVSRQTVNGNLTQTMVRLGLKEKVVCFL